MDFYSANSGTSNGEVNRSKTLRRDYLFNLAWESLRIPKEDLKEKARENCTWTTLLTLLKWLPRVSEAERGGMMDGGMG